MEIRLVSSPEVNIYMSDRIKVGKTAVSGYSPTGLSKIVPQN